MLTMGSLFAGIGGFDLGFERAGFKTVWQVEINEYCRKVLERHFPDAERYADIRECGVHNLKPVDVICGGFPCQPFSSASAGRKRGIADDRFLWPEMCRIIDGLRPRWIICENVTHFDGVGLEQVVSDMEGIGYEVLPTLEIPACAVGHDHRRARLWILAYSNGNGQSGGAKYAEVAILPQRPDHSRGLGEEDGISTRVDRLTALGNAVVPQIPELIARRLKELL